MTVYIIVDNDATRHRDAMCGVYTSRESAENWIKTQSWVTEEDKEWRFEIVESELE